MTSIAPQGQPEGKDPRRNRTVRSFVWEPAGGAELSACPDCANWHALFEWDDPSQTLYLREWHEATCPCWTED